MQQQYLVTIHQIKNLKNNVEKCCNIVAHFYNWDRSSAAPASEYLLPLEKNKTKTQQDKTFTEWIYVMLS